jgi:hypothetical protein
MREERLESKRERVGRERRVRGVREVRARVRPNSPF